MDCLQSKEWQFLLVIALYLINARDVKAVTQCAKSTYNKLSSKSGYHLLRNKPKHPITYPGCEPILVYFIARHGSRYPSSRSIEKLAAVIPKLKNEVVHNAEEGKGFLCEGDIAELKNWTLDMESAFGHSLVKEGASELHSIGRTLRDQFPSLFTEAYSPLKYLFRSSVERRAIESATNFSAGLFSGAEDIEKYVIINNTLLRHYKKCDKWLKEVKKDSKKEKEKFLNEGPEMAKLIKSVTVRLGLTRTLTLGEIQLIYALCQFHTAIVRPVRQPTSVWCQMFSDEELQILEYADDLTIYWKDGYGYSLSLQLACPVLQDIISQFRVVATSDGGNSGKDKWPIGLFHFTHSGLLMKLFAALGLFRDEVPQLSGNYANQTNRKWRTSYIDPFASNLQLVLFSCSAEKGTVLQVAAYVQQQEVLLPNCTSFLCPLERFMDNYMHYMDICDLQKLCTRNLDTIILKPEHISWLRWMVTSFLIAVAISASYILLKP